MADNTNSEKEDMRELLRLKRVKNGANALKEAAARQNRIDAATQDADKEQQGRGGLDPARFGDWEVKGIASDF